MEDFAQLGLQVVEKLLIGNSSLGLTSGIEITGLDQNKNADLSLFKRMKSSIGGIVMWHSDLNYTILYILGYLTLYSFS